MKQQHLLLLLLGASFYWMYLLYQPFLMTILIAALLAVSTAKLQCHLTTIARFKLLGVLLTTLLLAILFFVPLGYFLANVTIKLNQLDPDTVAKITTSVKTFLAHPPSYLNFIKPYIGDVLNHMQLNDMTSKLLTLATTVGVYSAGFLKNAFLIIVFYFFAQYYGDVIIDFVKNIIKFSDNDNEMIVYELSSVMSTVFYSILATAIFEGALFGIAVSFMGYNGILYGIMYGFSSLIPVIGGAVMWLPFTIYELIIGDVHGAIFIAVYSIVVISIIADTFIKPVIIKEINVRFIKSEIQPNELIIFFAIIAGLATFGFWGMILGPAITSFFLALLKLVQIKPISE